MFNTIIFKKGYARFTNVEYIDFNKGNTIWGANSDPEEIKRWNIDEKEEAVKELNKFRCLYRRVNKHLMDVEEYALEICECGEDGEYISGSDYQLAPEA